MSVHDPYVEKDTLILVKVGHPVAMIAYRNSFQSIGPGSCAAKHGSFLSLTQTSPGSNTLERIPKRAV